MTTLRDAGSSSRPTAFVGTAAFLVAAGIALFTVDAAGGLVGLLRVPAVAPQFVEYVEEATGRDIVGSPGLGHDGKFFFALAVDPFLLDPELNASWLDRPVYRAQRILYPMLAGGFGLLSPPLVLWGLVIVNIAAMGLGSWALARIATALGGSPWLGFSFVINPGMTIELALDGSSILAWALAAWGLAELLEKRSSAAAGLLSLAVLARESLGVVAVGAFLFVWFTTRRAPWRVLVAPAATGAVWWAWVRVRVGHLPATGGAGSVVFPLQGLSRGVLAWFETGGLTLLLGLMVFGCVVVVIASAWKRPDVLSWSTIGFVPLLLVLHEDVLKDGLNLVRAVAPLVSSGLVLLVIAVTSRGKSLLPSPF